MKRVLYVEDSPTLRSVFKQWMASVDCAVDLAESGEIALYKLSDVQYEVDVVVVDYQMGGINGLEFGQMVWRMFHRRSVKVVMLTGHATPALQADCEQARFSGCFKKGEDNQLLLVNCVRELLSSDDAQGRYEPIKLQQPRVLYVEDSPTLRDLFGKFLSDARCILEMVENGEQAYGILKNDNHQLDLIVLDYTLGQIDGLSLAKRVREMPHHAKTPLILYTSSQDENVLQAFKNLGDAKCFKKGHSDWDKFAACVLGYLNLNGSAEQNISSKAA